MENGIKVLGVVVNPIIKGYEWQSRAIFELPIAYCKYLNLKPKDTLRAIIRRKEKGEITIFLNTQKDSKMGQECILSDRYTITLRNFVLGLKSTDFFEINVVNYNDKSLSIKLQEIKKLPRYMTKKELVENNKEK